MNKIGSINYKEIKRISPSQFYSMKNCAYKSILAEAFEKKPLLPISSNAYLGTVFHKMLEFISNGTIKNENDFNFEFNFQIKKVEKELLILGCDFLVPLKLKSKNFGLKQIQLKKHLQIRPEYNSNVNEKKYYTEKWFESNDSMIGGKVDLIIENKNGVEIVDFKTGAITEDYLDDDGELFSDVKTEYKDQLKLYAYLYFENTKKIPTNLTLIDLGKNRFQIDFTLKECREIYEKAKDLLYEINQSIINKTFSVIPKVENCKYCLYRPACSFFRKNLETDYSFNDVIGVLIDIKRFQNGNVSVFLQNGNQSLTIRNFYSEIFDELEKHKNKQIIIYNVRKEATEFNYSVSDTTMIYEY